MSNQANDWCYVFVCFNFTKCECIDSILLNSRKYFGQQKKLIPKQYWIHTEYRNKECKQWFMSNTKAKWICNQSGDIGLWNVSTWVWFLTTANEIKEKKCVI